ncbi:putative oxidoreductase ENV9 [Lipomyces tetrasporus]|uniref:Oxidoreductase ENV9 n=1 Tax=Lipomyces tetrasporus TaxID=54092 RepID=A0AAD7VSY5_9ASCO|nr:putative oxidoreductase ENV9 [Lipomyces tetrasporus]KAJ8099520.1 putative oxidoreductase ENV9 [Lipomyces tetrasporus]
MVHLDAVRACNKALVKRQSITAVFVGGTSGIGEYAARALASTHGTSGRGLRMYIVGRNEAAANTVIAECREACPAGKFYFVPASDLSSLREVDRVCRQIVNAEEASAAGKSASIDLLVMSQAMFAFGGRLGQQETSEGLEQSLSLLYYSRMRFITQLLPLLLASPLSGRVVSVFGPGRDSKLVLDDLPLRNPENFGFGNLGSHAAYMTTFFFEKLATSHPGKLSLSHYFPGIVITPAYKSDGVPAWFKRVFTVARPLFRLLSVPAKECGERVLFHTSPRFPARSSDAEAKSPAKLENIKVALSSDGVLGGGAYRTNWNAEVVPLGKGYKQLDKDEVKEKVWDHTMKAFQEISSGGYFSG